MSLRCHGIQFDPIVSSNHDGTYTVEACITPGRDEVLFDTFKAKGCEIAPGDPFGKPKRPFSRDKVSISALVCSAHTDRSERSYFFIVRPSSDAKKIQFVIKGGWLNQLNATRHLEDRL